MYLFSQILSRQMFTRLLRTGQRLFKQCSKYYGNGAGWHPLFKGGLPRVLGVHCISLVENLNLDGSRDSLCCFVAFWFCRDIYGIMSATECFYGCYPNSETPAPQFWKGKRDRSLHLSLSLSIIVMARQCIVLMCCKPSSSLQQPSIYHWTHFTFTPTKAPLSTTSRTG